MKSDILTDEKIYHRPSHFQAYTQHIWTTPVQDSPHTAALNCFATNLATVVASTEQITLPTSAGFASVAVHEDTYEPKKKPTAKGVLGASKQIHTPSMTRHGFLSAT